MVNELKALKEKEAELAEQYQKQKEDALGLAQDKTLGRRVLADPRAIGGVYNVNHPDNPSWNELLSLVEYSLIGMATSPKASLITV